MKLFNKFNSIGLQSGLYSFFSYSLVLVIFIFFILELITSEIYNYAIKDNEEYSLSFLYLLDTNIDSYNKEIKIEASKTIILNTVFTPEETQYYIDDYLNEMRIGGLEWDVAIIDFDKELIVKTDNFDLKKNDTKWLKENKNSTYISNNKIYISSPILYNGSNEGYLQFCIEFHEVFNKALGQILLEDREKQFKAFFNNNLIASTDKKSDKNIIFTKQLSRIPVTIEVLTPENRIFHSINKLRSRFIYLAIIFSIISVLLLSFIVSKSLGIPLKKLKEDIENATLTENWDFKYKKNTAIEIVFVGNAFNKVHRKLIRRTKELEEKNCVIESANNNLKKTQEKLIQSEKMASIGQLAAGVAHEINNPTGFVNTNLQTLNEYIVSINRLYKTSIDLIKNKIDVEAFNREFNQINEDDDLEYIFSDISPLINESLDGTKRIRDIVQGLRDFARKDSDEFKLGNVNNSIEDAIRLTWNEIKYKCTVHKKLRDIPDTICNQDQLTQVFVNLLINSSHAISDKGDIYIYSSFKNDKFYIRFSDTGSGISKDNLNKLFDPFFSTKEVGKGTGLGLSIVHGIIEKHKGSIRAKSVVGKATCFIIELPLLAGD